jgi:MATE family multidrug resistance protein
MILTNLVEMALTTTDVMLMGRLGPQTLAAGILATNLFFGLAIPGLGLVIAVSPLIAKERGGRPHAVREVRRTVRQGLWSALLLSVLALLVLSQTASILRALGQDPLLADRAASYMNALMWGLPAFLGYIVLRSTVAALGRPQAALWAALVAIPVNAALAYALMFGRFGFPDLGLSGAGVATAIATWVMFAILALQLVTDRRFRRYRFFGRWWEVDMVRLLELWRVGLPIGAALTFEVTIFNAAAFLMGMVSETALAAHAIAIQICSVSFMVPLGIGQAATVRVGLALGARNEAGIALAGRVAFALGVSFMVMTAIVMLLAPSLLAGLFIDVTAAANQEVVRLAAVFLFFGGLFQIADGAQVVVAGMLRGLQDTRVPMLFAGLGYWIITLPLAIVLGFGLRLGGTGIWAALALGLAIVAVLMTLRWWQRAELGLIG